MAVHGLGDHRNSTWEADWEKSLKQVFPGKGDVSLEFHGVNYDHIFEKTDISFWETAGALSKLTLSAAGSLFRRRKGILGGVSNRIKWTAGYVVAWVEDDEFQRQTRRLMFEKIREIKPDIILAHSLGSLITYNTFTHPDAEDEEIKKILRKARYVTFGSQIGNPFVVRNLTPGRIEPLKVRHWYHLYNPEDDVFTAPIRLWDADNFQQVHAYFDSPGFADHSAICYLQHENTIEEVWRPIAETAINGNAFGPRKASRKRTTKTLGRSRRRALLIGINEYPNEKDRLEGCVNDVYLMSSLLQECGFEPEDIRVCLDERATAKGITDRMEWLLDDPQPNDERVFYYSGHGTTIPEYGEGNEPDRLTETLVPWDFDWSAATAISDDQIWMMYSQLPYNTRLAMIFDCCHSGGMHRDGGARVKGMTPPDDIRHRSLKWDSKSEMWVERDFKRLNKTYSSDKAVQEAFFGKNGSTERFGRAGMVRGRSEKKYNEELRGNKGKKEAKIDGPYLPLIVEACAEDELSYEYRHGVTSYGAFTFALNSILRRRKRITFEDLVGEARKQLGELGYAQRPQVLGPSEVVKANVPWVKAG